MYDTDVIGKKRFTNVNWVGIFALIRREIMRFLSVWTQTLIEPIVTTALFLTIFYFAVGSTRSNGTEIDFLHFLAPGILAMTVIQNAFANTSSSIGIAKLQGNIVDTLMAPLSPLELAMGYIIGGVVRGLIVGCMIAALLGIALGIWVQNPLWWLGFLIAGGAFMSALGALTGIYAQRFDQMAAISSFVIAPLSFLSGSFYSVSRLPEFLQKISYMNPIFYIIDGVRFGIIGYSDSRPEIGLALCCALSMLAISTCWFCFRQGYGLKS